jgi:transcription-repair coupling factor (superfamily II helicase)
MFCFIPVSVVYQIEETDTNVFASCRSIKPHQFAKKPAVIVSYPSCLKKSSYAQGFNKTLKVTVGDKISIDFINEVLFEYEFKELILLQSQESFLFEAES